MCVYIHTVLDFTEKTEQIYHDHIHLKLSRPLTSEVFAPGGDSDRVRVNERFVNISN